MNDQKKQRFHVRRGDQVVVISGSSKGRQGTIREVLTSSHRSFLKPPMNGRRRVRNVVAW